MDATASEAASTRILIVDDDSDHRDRIAPVVSTLESVTTAVVDSLEAVRRRLDGDVPTVGCVVSSGSHGDVSGVELVRAISECDSAVPIVLSPPAADGVEASEAIAAGVTEYVPAELGEHALREAITRALAEGERARRNRLRAAMLRTLKETLPVSMYFKDTEARYVWVTSVLEPGTDETPIGKTDIEFWNGWESATEAYQDDLQVLQTGDPILEKEEYHETAQGEIWVQTTKLPWYTEDGEIRGLVGISQTISEQKLRERELQAQAKRFEQFARFVSHDLRNPVGVAKGYLEVARDTGDETALEEVDWALSRMDTLIEDLLTMVRGTDEEFTEVVTDIAGIAREVWETIDAPDATLTVSFPPGTSIQGVEGPVRRLFDNLFRNAIDHAGTDVSVVVGLTETGFFVEDDGPGVDLEDPNQILEDGYTERGTGIGLTIVRNIADTHGWEISVTDGRDGGVRLEFAGCVLLMPSLVDVRETDSHELDSDVTIGPTTAGRVESGADDRVTVTGYGRDVFFETDEHHFAYVELEGDVRIEARLLDVESIDEYSKAGVMLRSEPAAGSPLGYVGMTPSHGSESIWRPGPADRIETNQFEAYDREPRWYRLDLVGETATVYTSLTGENWTPIDQQRLEVDPPVAIGLAVCSHDAERPCSAVFEDVRVVGLSSPDDT